MNLVPTAERQAHHFFPRVDSTLKSPNAGLMELHVPPEWIPIQTDAAA
jgi:hypothetical protein